MTTNLTRVETACRDLATAGNTVTFAAIARRTGLGRTTLYRNPALRAVIDTHRRGSTTNLTRLSEDVATLTTTVTLLADRLRHHEEQLRALRTSPPNK